MGLCPNKSSIEWKQLEEKVGEIEAYRIWLENGGREKKAEIFQRGKEGWYADYVEKNRERIRANGRHHYHKNHPGARTYKGSAGIED